jgi:phage gp36-like protein
MATAWITITEADLRDTKASALVDAFTSAALGAGQTDPVPRAIIKVCDRIRAEIQSSKKYHVSATPHSIPPSLVELAGNLIAWRMQGRLNVLSAVPITDQDKIDHTEDLKYLERIAKGDVTIEIPTDPESTPQVQSGGMIETVQEGNSGNGREELSRL